MWAQLTTGLIEGAIRAIDGHPVAGAPITVSGGAGFRAVLQSDSNGNFAIALPYGRYLLSGGVAVFAAPLQTVRVDMVVDLSGAIRSATETAGRKIYPEGFSLPGMLLSREASSVIEPLDFTGLRDNRLAVLSQRGISWTGTQFKLHGMDATDSYQPGIPAILPDVQALAAVVVRSAFMQTTSSSSGSEIGMFLAELETGSAGSARWHTAFSTANTGGGFSWTNLPPTDGRGLVQQPEEFRWFTRDRLEIGGPVTRWADLYASGGGQWASQTEPLGNPGTDQGSRLLFGNVRGRVRAGGRDRFDALYSGSRIDLSDGGEPAGLEALTGNRMAPSFVLPGGFSGDPETDDFDFGQVGWTHVSEASSHMGVIEIRYGYSTAHLNTSTSVNGQSRIELLGGLVSGAPPLATLGFRPRHEMEAAWQPTVWRALGIRHRIVAGGGWKRSEPQNRFNTPSGMNLVTAGGAPAFVEEFNTPVDSSELVKSFSAFAADHVNLTRALSLDLGAFADLSRGSLPAQASLAGPFAPWRTFAAKADLIAWKTLSPRVGMGWQVPHSHGLVLRSAYFRVYEPLAGRYLDFGNPNGLGGSAYQWLASRADGPFQPGEAGNLLWRFGGPYSSISPSLHRPYADEFDIGAESAIAPRSIAGIHLFRRDTKERIAAIDTGVPAQAFTPVSILDPGPDGIPGTFDDQHLTVYAQNPATLGDDRYLLTNPAGLRMLNIGVLAEAGTVWRQLTLHASFVAEKSYGPTNPGDTIYANDPGVIGALFLDPNTAIHAAGNSFMDRGFIGKVEATYRLPRA